MNGLQVNNIMNIYRKMSVIVSIACAHSLWCLTLNMSVNVYTLRYVYVVWQAFWSCFLRKNAGSELLY